MSQTKIYEGIIEGLTKEAFLGKALSFGAKTLYGAGKAAVKNPGVSLTGLATIPVMTGAASKLRKAQSGWSGYVGRPSLNVPIRSPMKRAF